MTVGMFNERVREILEKVSTYGGFGEYPATIRLVLTRYLRFSEIGHRGSHLSFKRHGPWVNTSTGSFTSPNTVWGDGTKTGIEYRSGKHREAKGILSGTHWRRVLGDVFWWKLGEFSEQQKLWDLTISSRGTHPAIIPPSTRDPESMKS